MALAIGLVTFSALFLGVMVVARSPNFWYGLLAAMVAAALPFISKRNTPEVEKEMQKCARMGGEWDNFNKVCRFK
jgi:hypothetical protein